MEDAKDSVLLLQSCKDHSIQFPISVMHTLKMLEYSLFSNSYLAVDAGGWKGGFGDCSEISKAMMILTRLVLDVLLFKQFILTVF